MSAEHHPEPSRPISAVLLIHCPDRKGINAAVTQFVSSHNGNIIDYDQHVDLQEGIFFMRIEWDMEGFLIPRGELADRFAGLAESYRMQWQLSFSDEPIRTAIFVSRQPHCLYDMLARWKSGEWNMTIPIVIGNHPDLAPVAEQFGVDFRAFPIAPETRERQEQAQIDLLRERQVELVVLARYMQVLSPLFIRAFPHRVINIHHSFLPAFAGARPYHAAYSRGVKIVGATSHYATEELDQGPIIEQDTIRVTHKDAIADLIRKGRDLEKIVLARAVWAHLQRKVLVYGNKTVIFE